MIQSEFCVLLMLCIVEFMFFLQVCYSSGEHFNSCTIFHGRLKAGQIFSSEKFICEKSKSMYGFHENYIGKLEAHSNLNLEHNCSSDQCTSAPRAASVRGFVAVGHLAVGQFAVRKMLVSVRISEIMLG